MKDTEQCAAEMGNIYISSEQIIQEVQKFRCLYDPADPDHKDRDVMRDAWLSVTQAVVGEPWANLNSAEKNEAVKEARGKWRNTKDTMRKAVLRRITPAGSVGTKKRPYHHYNKLAFLLETDSFKKLLDGAKDRAHPRTKKFRAISKQKHHTTRPFIHVMKKKDTTFESDSSSLSSPHDAASQPEQDNISEQVHSDKSVHQNVSLPELLKNPDWMFMFSLLPRVGALKSRDKLDFQIKVMQLLQGYETDDSSL